MKKVIVVAAALLASSAQATSGLDFGDINYLLKSGQFNLTSNVNVVNTEVQNKNAGTKFEENGYHNDNRFAYGLMDNLTVFAGAGLAFQNSLEISGQRDSSNNGFTDPSLGVIYRAANQNDSYLNVDFGATATFSFMDAKRGVGGNKDGNFYDGQNKLELNTRIGRKWNEANEWQVSAGAVRNFKGEMTLKDASGDNKSDIDASTDFFLRAGYQYRPVQEFMMLVQGTATRAGKKSSEDKNSVETKTDSYVDYNFLFNAKYLVTETFIVKFNYSLNHLAEPDVKVGGVSDQRKNRFQNYYGFGIDWLF